MRLSNCASVFIALLTLAIGHIMETVQAEDKMPPTINIVPRLRARGKIDFVSDSVRIDNFPVPNFYISGDFGEEKGGISPVGGVAWFLRATPGVLPDNRLLQVGSAVRGLGDRRREGQLVPLCGHVYCFSRKEKEGLLTLLADHSLQFEPKDKARYFSVSGSFKWGNDVEDFKSRGAVVSGSYNQVLSGENGRLSIKRYTTLSKSETAAVVDISCTNKNGRDINIDQALKFKLKIADDGPSYHILKLDDHIKTDEFDFVVRRIIPPDGKDNPGWIDLELLTGAPAAQDK